ncbi:MAG TPA: hypothetical protein VF221_08970 [Chloroflexota bacterium]
MSQYAVTIIIAALLLVFVVYQQMRTRSIQSRQLIVVPVFLALLGIINLQKHPPDSTAASVALAASVLTAIVFGVGRGVTVQIWRAGDVLMRKGTAATLVLWVVGIALRIVIGIVAGRSGVPTSVTTGELPLFLGITLAAQNVLIWLRSQEVAVARAS